ncbi:MAG: M24 family metallopeptidase [Ilumatobacteraceae bacterium]
MIDLSVAERRRRARQLGASTDDQPLLLTCNDDVRWCSGFTGSNGWLLLDDSRTTLLTDGRYVDQAKHEVDETVEIVECRTASAMIDHITTRVGSRTLLVQGEHMTVALARRIQAALTTRLVLTADTMADLRRTKSSTEIATIRRAASIADLALADLIPTLIEGTTERELRDSIENFMRQHGADGPSYDTIIAAGPTHSAHPHHRPTDRPLSSGDSVVIDVGALLDGYHSDMTRTFFVGDVSAEIEHWYGVLLEAQLTALNEVGPGVPVKHIDSVCRSVLKREGLEELFSHGLGHGVGLQIHENPFLNGSSDAVLMPGDVVTIEPGLYRGGVGGMRIEDLVLVTAESHDILTNSPKDPKCPR